MATWSRTSCLFDKEHGVRAMLPFLHHYFPEAKIVPIAMSVKAKRGDWDRLAEAMKPVVDKDTLIVESTDFSHYLPQHDSCRRFDQQSLNMLAAGSLDGIAALHQPDHADSVGALYIQTRLQRELFGAQPLVVANENSQEHTSDYVERTTSQVVALLGAFGPGFNNPGRPKDRIYYLAGDVNFGRAMKKILVRDGVADKIVDSILALTGSRPLIVNLEGVILPNVPEAIDDMTLAMPEDLAAGMLKRLHVAGVSLANNHAYDLGPSGYAETLRALDAAQGIPHFGQGETLALADLDLVGLTDIDTNGSKNTDLLTPALLDRLLHENARRPVVAFVHWGREYKTEPSAREEMLADEMRLRGVSAIVGGHPHVSSEAIIAACRRRCGGSLFARQLPVRPESGAIVGIDAGTARLSPRHDLHQAHPAAQLFRDGQEVAPARPRYVEIRNVRPSRKWLIPRTGAERYFYVSTVLLRRSRTGKRRYRPFAGRPHLNINIP